MKTLLACIIIGLLSLSPAFAESSMDKKQKETDQNGRSEQTDVQPKPKVLLESDEDRQANETDQHLRHDQADEESQMMLETDSYQESEQNGDRTQKSDEGRQ